MSDDGSKNKKKRQIPEHSSVNDPEQRAMDNIPEFRTEPELGPADWAKHGSEMFATGIIEGLRQAIYAIEQDREEIQPSRNWAGMNCAIAAVKRAIANQACKNSNRSQAAAVAALAKTTTEL